MQAKNGKLENLLTVLKGDNGLPTTRSYDGCLSIEMTVNKETNTVWLVENWESTEKFITYLDWRQNEDDIIQTMAPMLEGEESGLKIVFSNSGYKSF
jgi:quinol monooxygenase YgiN